MTRSSRRGAGGGGGRCARLFSSCHLVKSFSCVCLILAGHSAGAGGGHVCSH